MIRSLLPDVREKTSQVMRAGDDHTFELFLGELADVISCWKFSHPDQPKAKAKYQQTPWRCARCKTWWVTFKYTDYAVQATHSYEWRWKRVDPQ